MPVETFTQSTAALAVAPWTGENGSRFVGVVIGLLGDFLAEGAATAWEAGQLYPRTPRPEDYRQPLDAIERLGRDALILRYPGESHYGSLRQRVRDKWIYWTGSIKDALLADFAAAGMPGAEIYVPNDFSPAPAPDTYWSRFWAVFPLGTHPVTAAAGFIVGTDVVGAKRIGPAGLNTDTGALWYAQLKGVIKRLKPAQWVNWDIIFEISTGPSVYVNLMNRKRSPDVHYEYTGTNFPVAP